METHKVLDICDYIHLVCIKIDNETELNPYRLYIEYPVKNKYGYYTTHKKQIAKYGNMASILCMVKDMYIEFMQHKSINQILAWCKEYNGIIRTHF